MVYVKETYKEMRTRIFLSKMSKRKTKKGCILWKGTLNKRGYGGHVRWLNDDRLLAHRLSYIIHYGEFDRSLHVLHKCDNPTCVNPKHLFLGTPYDNAQDKKNKGRGRKKAEYYKKKSSIKTRVRV